MKKLLAAVCASLLVPVHALAQEGLLLGVWTSSGQLAGTITALTVGAAPTWTSPTDLTPVSQYVNGYTAEATVKGVAPAGVTSAYGFTPASAPFNPASNYLAIPVTSPGYNSSAVLTTISRTVYGTSWLRQVQPNYTLPTEAASGSNALIDITLSDFVYGSDTLGAATLQSALYTSGGTVSRAGSVMPTNASTQAYPKPICVWVTPPGQRVGASGSLTVEMRCDHVYGQSGRSVAAVVFTVTDGTHTATKTVSSEVASSTSLTATCTGTNGSNVLTSCNSTAGWIVGMRAVVPGIPGQPKLLSKTSTSLTFGVTNANCTTTLNSGNITVTNAALATGEVIADGAFPGATITDANIITPAGTATITSNTVTADVTIAAGLATQAVVHTNATVTTAATNASCTIAHVYQGSTGSVTATAGAVVPVYQATFTQASDLSTFTDGALTVRAQAYPFVGNATAVLDSQTGSDGTQCDWFYINVNSGVCNSSSAAWFNTNGQQPSTNLHNSWAYLDAAGAYTPIYAWVSGTAGGSPAVQTSSADPGSGAYYANVSTAVTALKTYYNANKAHNDANGGVICILAAGSPYAGWGAAMYTNFTTGKPPLTMTSATSGAACSATGSANADTSVTITHSASANFNTVPPWTRINNLKLADGNTIIQGLDTNNKTTFPTYAAVFNNDWFQATAATGPILYKIGAWYVYNSYVDESAFDGYVLRNYSNITAAPALVFGSTLICGTATTSVAQAAVYNWMGNNAFSCNASSQQNNAAASGADFYPQPTGLMADHNFSLIQGSKQFAFNAGSIANAAIVGNSFECVNDSGQNVCVQVTADQNNIPASNILYAYNTVSGQRTNFNYLEGIPPSLTSCTTTGGALSAATYYVQVGYALKTNPTVVTSTDGVGPTGKAVSSGTTGSCTISIAPDPNYVVYLYFGTSSTTPANYATVAAADAKQLATGAIYTITGLGSAVAAPVINVGGITGHNELKILAFKRFNMDQNCNTKTDTYAASGATASGGRVGDWSARWHSGWVANVCVTATVITPTTPGPTSGMGEMQNWMETANISGGITDLSWTVYKSDRSWGTNSASLVSPSLNLGRGNYCIVSFAAGNTSRVPSGYASEPYDILGNPRLNDGTGYPGAYENGCQ